MKNAFSQLRLGWLAELRTGGSDQWPLGGFNWGSAALLMTDWAKPCLTWLAWLITWEETVDKSDWLQIQFARINMAAVEFICWLSLFLDKPISALKGSSSAKLLNHSTDVFSCTPWSASASVASSHCVKYMVTFPLDIPESSGCWQWPPAPGWTNCNCFGRHILRNNSHRFWRVGRASQQPSQWNGVNCHILSEECVEDSRCILQTTQCRYMLALNPNPAGQPKLPPWNRTLSSCSKTIQGSRIKSFSKISTVPEQLSSKPTLFLFGVSHEKCLWM